MSFFDANHILPKISIASFIGKLDMRMDVDAPGGLTAETVVNSFSEEDLADIIWKVIYYILVDIYIYIVIYIYIIFSDSIKVEIIYKL